MPAPPNPAALSNNASQQLLISELQRGFAGQLSLLDEVLEALGPDDSDDEEGDGDGDEE